MLRGIDAQQTSIYPYPLSIALKRYIDKPPEDDWGEWERLSRNILQPILMYLSHLLLSDLVSTNQKPTRIYHRIQSILSRPMAGHYAGFLREATKYYQEENLKSGIPELIDFLNKSELDCSLTGNEKPLIGLLVDYRNLWAHGKIENKQTQKEIVEEIKRLTEILLKEISFLEKYPLETEEGKRLMGYSSIEGLGKDPQVLKVISSGGLVLRPLLLKLKGEDISLLEDVDISAMRITYRGSNGYNEYKKKDVKSGDGKKIFEDLVDLLKRVRSEEAVLPQAGWMSYKERAGIITDKTIALYEEMSKYRRGLYVEREEWEGKEGIFRKFMESDRVLLAVNGVQGTGKSALVSKFAVEMKDAGEGVLLINAQRFTFAKVEFQSENPYPEYFSNVLHYEREIDKEQIGRIVKGAKEEGKKVVLVIDAINEVDGLEAKWNRFVAMEKLLEWISRIAQPNLKVILSFRLEVYEDFEYLLDDEVPENLIDISYQGNNPRKKWVWDIEPFNETQAEELYQMLQKEPQLGMAPKMSWDKIKEGLGEEVKEVIDNPLIFTVFLRAHHNEERVIEKKRDEIFLRYAEKLTGALEEKKKPWWQKVWGFIKNGNITKKEMFLAGVIEKMSQEGGAAFLVERLNPKNKKDKKLKEVLDDPKSEVLKDLKEGGLIIEEKIELTQESKQVYSRRITFVGELMGFALRRIWEIIFVRTQIKRIITSIVTYLLVFGFIISVLIVVVRAAAKTSNIVVLADLGTIVMLRFLLPILLVIYTSFIIYDVGSLWEYVKIRKVTKKYWEKIVIVRKSRESFFKKVNKRLEHFATFLGIEGLLLTLSLFLLFPSIVFKNLIFYLTPLIGALFFLIMLLVKREMVYSLTLYFIEVSSKRLFEKSLKIESDYINNPSYQKFRFSLFIKGIIPYFLLVIIYLLYSFLNTSSLKDSYNFANMISVLTFRNFLTLWYHTIAISLILFFIIAKFLVFKKGDNRKFASFYFKKSKSKFSFKQFTRIAYSTIFLITLINIYFLSQTKNSLNTKTNFSVIKEYYLTTNRYRFNSEGKLTFLDLSENELTAKNMKKVETLFSLESLILPSSFELPFDISKLKSLSTLSISAKALRGENNNLQNLTLFNPNQINKNLRFESVTKLNLIGKEILFNKISHSFPNIEILNIEENNLCLFSKNIEQFNSDLILAIFNETDSTIIKLECLDRKIAEHIIFTVGAPIDETKNLDLLERIIIKGDNLDPRVFEKAHNLKWLGIRISKAKSKEWLDLLRSTVLGHLDNIISFELFFNPNDGIGLKGLKYFYSAQGKPEIQKMLNRLIQNPNLLDNHK